MINSGNWTKCQLQELVLHESGGRWFLLPVSLLWNYNLGSVEPKGSWSLCAVMPDSSVTPGPMGACLSQPWE